jgi:type I restriction enzyme M protein
MANNGDKLQRRQSDNTMDNFNEKVNFIYSVAEVLRGPYKPNQYKKVMLPMTVLRRLDCVLEPTKEAVLAKLRSLEGGEIRNVAPILNAVAGQSFHNTSPFTFETLKNEPENIAANLTHYIKGFSSKAREIIDHFGFEEQIAQLDKNNVLYLVVKKFHGIDLHPDRVSNLEMGYIFEELIRRFNEISNEEAGDHFTPREVIRLMVNLLFCPDNDVLTTKGIVKTLCDPACGTGGMLSISEEYLHELNPDARLEVFGQDYNEEAYAICGSDMMIKGQSLDNIHLGNIFTEDHLAGKTFDYLLANPPFGVKWEKEEDDIRKEYQQKGFSGRFGAGLPAIDDGALLFLQHMISKMKTSNEGTRLAIVFNASPLFTGSAVSGESKIRRWIIENDWLEGIVALPDQLFYNTGINTYIWIVTNRKEKHRRGKVQLIDASGYFKKMRRSLGEKRNEISDNQRDEITRLYGDFIEGEHVRIFDNSDFGYRRVTIERPLRLNFAVTEERLTRVQKARSFVNLASSKKRKDAYIVEAEIDEGRHVQETILTALGGLKAYGVVKNRGKFAALMRTAFKQARVKVPTQIFNTILKALSDRDETADICTDSNGKPEPDSELRDYENVPLKEDIREYMQREVIPYVPDAWGGNSASKIGYSINFLHYFFKYEPPRALKDINDDLKRIEKEIADMLSEADE